MPRTFPGCEDCRPKHRLKSRVMILRSSSPMAGPCARSCEPPNAPLRKTADNCPCPRPINCQGCQSCPEPGTAYDIGFAQAIRDCGYWTLCLGRPLAASSV